jgi:hypothetical protein
MTALVFLLEELQRAIFFFCKKKNKALRKYYNYSHTK